MAGRGFLKSRIAQPKAAKEIDEPHNSQGLPNHDELSKVRDLCISQELPKPHELTKEEDQMATVCPPSLINGGQKPLRGRRALLANILQGRETLTGGEISTPNVLNGHAVRSSAGKSGEVKLQQDVKPEPKEKSPVVCRVVKKSDKDSYQMSQLSSNYIKIEIEQDKGIYKYVVDYKPPIDAKPLRFKLLNVHRDMFPMKVFDGTLLYIPKKLPRDVTTLVGTLNDGTEITMTVTYKCKNSLSECIHFYGVFLRTIMKKLGLIQFGDKFFDPEKKINVPEFKLDVWPGFVTVIDEYENGLYMCCDVSHRILRTETVLQLMTQVSIQSKNRGTDHKQELMSTLCGATVITHYNHKTYRIDDIDFSITPLSTFNQYDTEISYVVYYKQMYDIEIKNLNQPMLISKPKKKDIAKSTDMDSDICCLVPELCYLTGLTEAMRSDFKIMKGLQSYTLVTPEVRQKTIINLVNRINEHEEASKISKSWGLVMCPIPVKLEGPVYKRESIILGNGMRKQVGINMEWSKDVVKNAMFSAVNLYKWAILFSEREETTAQSFSRQLAQCGRPLGMNINQPVPIKVHGTQPESFVTSINNTINNNPDLQILVIIFPNQREDRYNAVKRICCAQIGIPSQVIVSRTLSRPERLQSITQNIALQMNCKLGGACWSIEIPLKNTMIVGIDVYHEKSKNLTSVVGFVASTDKKFTEWYSVAGLQKNTRQEVLNSIQNYFHKALAQFKSINGLLPEKIIIYRDGVSNGDLELIKETELNSVEESFKIFPNYCPMVTFITVQKRINTRVFQYLDKIYSNPCPGTVIDNTITRRNVFDFFLVSQNVRQGTVNPTHYIVLKNGCNLSTENVQRLSYKLCHLYYNWCGTVKVPAPVQYAHKLAYLIGQNVRLMPHDNLTRTLFFL